jgi:hypothetical protein
MHPKPSYDRLPRDLGLELLGHRGFDEGALAMRTSVGQRDFVAFADLFGRRRRAVSVATVLGTRLTAGTLGLGFGRPFAERCRLPFAGAERFLQAPGQLGDLSLEFGDLLLQGPTTGAGGFVHPAIVGTAGSFSCASFDSQIAVPVKGTLNKYSAI